MLVSVINESTTEQALGVMLESELQADLIEWRLDCLTSFCLQSIKFVRQQCKVPMIFTLRPIKHGGHFSAKALHRLGIIKQLLAFEPDYIDIEHDVKNDFIDSIHQQYPNTKIIRSYHDFETTPEDLDSLFKTMQHPAVAIYKVVTTAQTALDNLRVLAFVKQHAAEKPLTAFCMGELGQATRVLGKIMGNHWQYAGEAQGQLSLELLKNIYRYEELNQNTAIYALIGDPVSQSMGHLFHNAVFKSLNINAVYVKMPVTVEQTQAFLQQAPALGFKGFSVTMPLKQTVIDCLDTMDSDVTAMNACNTLAYHEGQYSGFNTDGFAAIDAITKRTSVAHKHCLILGAGGAARAIAHSAANAKAQLTIANRDFDKAQHLASQVNGTALSLQALSTIPAGEIELIINTIPAAISLPQNLISPDIVYFDAVYGGTFQSTIKAQAQAAGALYIDGQDMFYNQARAQQACWA